MASEIRVNQINNRSGLSTVTFSDTGVIISGITTISDLRTSGNTVVASGSTSAPSISPTGDSNTGIFFPSADTIAFAEGGVESLRVDSSGNLGIGTNNPTKSLHISQNSDVAIRMHSGNSNTNARSWEIVVGGNASNNAEMVFRTRNDAGTGGSEAARFTDSGNLAFPSGQGIDFSATANSSGTMSSELLADYEEGSWTPRISGTSGGNYTPGADNVGRYTKIGRIVTASATIHWTAAPTPYSGLVVITGLPYSSLNVSGYRTAGIIPAQSTGIYSDATYPVLAAGMDANQSFVYVVKKSDLITSGGNYSHTPAVNSSGSIYGFTITYVTN